jgi:hypothetical protein
LNRHNRVYVTDPILSEIRSTPCAPGSLCAHREPGAQGVLHVCCKQTLKIAMDALVTGFCCSSTVTSINLFDKNRSEAVATPKRSGKGNDVAIVPSPKNRAGHFRSTRLKPFIPPVSPDAVSQRVSSGYELVDGSLDGATHDFLSRLILLLISKECGDCASQ